MYNEENDKKRDFSLLKNFIMKLILIIIFVLLLVKFIPWPDMSGLAPLQEQIFNNNLTTMKEAAIAYYTTERLPENVGDKKTMTLQEMLDLKLLVPFVDKNGNTCSGTESYVSIEKVDSDEYNYKMKVNLKCSDKEDYIYVYLGCYSYCEGEICEKQEEPVATKKPSTSGGKPKPTVPTLPSNQPRPTLVPKPSNKPTPNPTDNPRPTYNPTPSNTPTPSNKPTPSNTPTPTNKPTPTPTPPVDKKYEYEYKKTTEAQYSAWSAWKVWDYSSTDKVNWTNTATYQIENLGAKKVQVGTRLTTAVVTRTVQAKVGTASYKVCKNYQYVGDRTNVWEITSDWQNTDQIYPGSTPPADTLETRWVLKSWDPANCVGDCTGHIKATWQLQKRTVKQHSSISNITATCTDVETRNIDIYIPTTKSETISKTQPLYGYKNFYRDRTRTVLQKATTTYTWSTYNNQTLLSQGWVATGEYREKK